MSVGGFSAPQWIAAPLRCADELFAACAARGVPFNIEAELAAAFPTAAEVRRVSARHSWRY